MRERERKRRRRRRETNTHISSLLFPSLQLMNIQVPMLFKDAVDLLNKQHDTVQAVAETAAMTPSVAMLSSAGAILLGCELLQD